MHAYRQSCLSILSQFQTHHLIPHSGKVVIFDSQLVVKHAFDAMLIHDLTCLAAGTLVATDNEVSVPIEEFSTEFLPSALGLHLEHRGLFARPVTHVLSRGVKPCMELLFSDGRSLTCTGDHLIRTAQGEWVRADQLIVGQSEVAVGIEYPRVSRMEDAANVAAFRLELGHSATVLDCSSQRAMAFARLLGYLMTDGSVCRDGKRVCGRLFLGHEMDAERVVRDVRLVTGTAPSVDRTRNLFVVELPDALVLDIVALGVSPDRRVSTETPFPPFLMQASCPTPVVREFLGGLFGGDGTTVRLSHKESGLVQISGVGFCMLRAGTVARAELVLWEAQLKQLMTRCGLATEHIRFYMVHSSPCGRPDAGRDALEELKANAWQLSHVVGDDEALDPNQSYAIVADLPQHLTPAFLSHIGFRYSVHKSMRLAAGVGYARQKLLWQAQRAKLVAIAKPRIDAGELIPSAIAAAKEQLSASELLHPAVVAWAPRLTSDLGTKATPPIQADAYLEATDTAKFFSERYSTASVSAPGGEADDGAAAAKLRNAVPRNARALPLFRVQLIAARVVEAQPTYDLTVPSEESRADSSFSAQGVVVHNCAPVWDSWKKKYVGLLSVSDFLDILMSTYAAEDKSMFDNLSNSRICDWAEYKKVRGTSINRLLCISPEATLHEAVRQLLNYRVHRLCVVQLALADTVLRIITNHGILRFLRNNSPPALTQSITVRQLGIGVFHNLLTLTYQTPVIKALELLSAYKVSSIPIVDDAMRPVDVYTRSDVRYLALDQTWTNLEMTIEEALSKHRRGRCLGLCSRDDSIHTVSGLLVSSMRHSLICVKGDGTIEGVVSLTDIFSFLLNANAPAAESRIAALMHDYAQFEAQERAQAEAAMAAATAAQDGSGGAGAAAAGPFASPRVSPSIRIEEKLRQQSFLADHGQGTEADDTAMLEEAAARAGAADGPVYTLAQTQGVDPAVLQSAIAAGTVSALPHPELLKQHLQSGFHFSPTSDGSGGAAGGSAGQ